MTFYDSVAGLPVFVAPRGRSLQEFIDESKLNGYISFREQEIIWENVKLLETGEVVTMDGCYLGRNNPDSRGDYYFINLSAIAGNPMQSQNSGGNYNNPPNQNIQNYDQIKFDGAIGVK